MTRACASTRPTQLRAREPYAEGAAATVRQFAHPFQFSPPLLTNIAIRPPRIFRLREYHIVFSLRRMYVGAEGQRPLCEPLVVGLWRLVNTAACVPRFCTRARAWV